MKAQILKMAGVASEAEFYKKYPTEEAFFEAYPEAQQMRQGGEMIKRADGSYSRRGMWDNIRANRGSGKKPTPEMREQERKIRAAEKAYGGEIPEMQFGGIMSMMNGSFVKDKQEELMGSAKEMAPMLMQLAPMLLGKGGSTYSGGVWFQGGGTAPMGVIGNPVYDWTKPITNPAVPLPKKVVVNADGTKTETGTFGEATTLFQVDPKQTAGAPTIAKDAGAGAPVKKEAPKDKWVAAQDALAKDAINPYSLQNVAGYAANFVDGINNYKNYQENLSKRREHYATDGMYNPNETSAMNRGQYDMYGTMAPANQSGMMSFTGMNQKYSFADGGDSPYESSGLSWIPKDLGPVAQPFINMAPAAPAGKAVDAKDALNLRFNLDGNFQDYAQKAQAFLDKKAPGTDISGVDLAGAAQAAYQKTGKLVPVELALAQLQIEGYLAKGNKANKPQRTKNPFNVGNTDNGSVVNHNSAASGINAYYDLMTTQYLKNKTPEELLVNFTNSKGNRYATDKTYEKKLRDTIGSMKFQDGGEMELTEAEINYIRAMGGEVEFL